MFMSCVRPIVRLAVLLALVSYSCLFSYAAQVVDVYLIGGQSNADGRADVSGLPTSPVNLQQPQADVEFYQSAMLTTLRPGLSASGDFGPEITFGRSMADYYANNSSNSVAIIKYASGGTNLHTQWRAGGTGNTTGDGPRYVVFQNTVASGLSALQAAHPGDSVRIAGMIWMQGESDAQSSAASAAYETNLTDFIADIRLTYDANLPFVIGQLSSSQTAFPPANLATIQNAQANIAAGDPNTSLVITNGFSLQADDAHFDAAGQQALGAGFAVEMQQLLAVPEPSCGMLIQIGFIMAALRRPRR